VSGDGAREPGRSSAHAVRAKSTLTKEKAHTPFFKGIASLLPDDRRDRNVELPRLEMVIRDNEDDDRADPPSRWKELRFAIREGAGRPA